MMKKFMTRAIVVVLIASTGLLAGCYGPFRLTNKIYDWNGQLSDKKFVNEVVFVAFCLIPVYEICLLGDGLIFNSIEFWGGDNPIAMKEGQIKESEIMHEGNKYKVIKTKNHLTVALKDTDIKADFQYFPEEKAWYQMKEGEKIQAVKLKGNKIYTYLPNQKTLVFDKNTADLIETEVMAAR